MFIKSRFFLAVAALAGAILFSGCSGGPYSGARKAPRSQERSPMSARIRDIQAKRGHSGP